MCLLSSMNGEIYRIPAPRLDNLADKTICATGSEEVIYYCKTAQPSIAGYETLRFNYLHKTRS